MRWAMTEGEKNKRPLVSVVMPTYNCAEYIEDSINSVINQTFTDWELIIVDDCSTSNTMPAILQKIKNIDKRISVYSTPINSGPGIARNIGIAQAQGQYLAFLDSDDYWYPTKLEQQVVFMQTNHYALSCTHYEITNNQLHPFRMVSFPSCIPYRAMLWGYAVGTQGIMIDRAQLTDIVFPARSHAEDWQLWLRLLKQTDAIHVLPLVLWQYRQTPCSINKRKVAIAKCVIEVYREEIPCSHVVAVLRLLFQYMPHLIVRKLLK